MTKVIKSIIDIIFQSIIGVYCIGPLLYFYMDRNNSLMAKIPKLSFLAKLSNDKIFFIYMLALNILIYFIYVVYILIKTKNWEECKYFSGFLKLIFAVSSSPLILFILLKVFCDDNKDKDISLLATFYIIVISAVFFILDGISDFRDYYELRYNLEKINKVCRTFIISFVLIAFDALVIYLYDRLNIGDGIKDTMLSGFLAYSLSWTISFFGLAYYQLTSIKTGLFTFYKEHISEKLMVISLVIYLCIISPISFTDPLHVMLFGLSFVFALIIFFFVTILIMQKCFIKEEELEIKKFAGSGLMYLIRGSIKLIEFDGTIMKVSISGVQEFAVEPEKDQLFNVLFKYENGKIDDSKLKEVTHKYQVKDELSAFIEKIYFNKSVAVFELDEDPNTNDLVVTKVNLGY